MDNPPDSGGPVSPYLPRRRGPLGDWLRDCRYALVYRVWKRRIRWYCRRRGIHRHHLRILEVGCGPGNFVRWLARWFRGAQIKAVDADAHLLAYAAKRVRGVKFEQTDACRLNEWDHCYDIVSCLQVIEHLPEPETFLQLARDCLKPGGLLLLATPNPQGWAARCLKERWQGIRSDHVSLHTPQQWRDKLATAGFEMVDDGTTLFNGLPVIGRLPLGIGFQVMQALFGYFHWAGGESYMAVARKPNGERG